MRLSKLTIFLGLFIVISASFMRQLFDFFYATIGRQVTIGILGISFILIFLFAFSWIICSPLCLRRKTSFLIVLVVGLFLSWRLRIVAERIHVLEYGLLGYLAARDVLKGSSSFKLIGFIILTVVFFALLDEGFQHILPYRYWDLRDIAFNLTGGIWGTGLFLIKKQPQG